MDKNGHYISCKCGHFFDISNIPMPESMPMEKALGFQLVNDEYYLHPEYQMTLKAAEVICDNCGGKLVLPSL